MKIQNVCCHHRCRRRHYRHSFITCLIDIAEIAWISLFLRPPSLNFVWPSAIKKHIKIERKHYVTITIYHPKISQDVLIFFLLPKSVNISINFIYVIWWLDTFQWDCLDVQLFRICYWYTLDDSIQFLIIWGENETILCTLALLIFWSDLRNRFVFNENFSWSSRCWDISSLIQFHTIFFLQLKPKSKVSSEKLLPN